MINWAVRFKNKGFWLSFIPAMLLLAQAVAALFGFRLELEGAEEALLDVVNALFSLPMTTRWRIRSTSRRSHAVSDSAAALTYTEPKR